MLLPITADMSDAEESRAVASPSLLRPQKQDEPSGGSSVSGSGVSALEERLAHLAASGRAAACNSFSADEVVVKRVGRATQGGGGACVVAQGSVADHPDPFVQLCSRLWSSPWVLLDRPSAAFKPDPPVFSVSLLPGLQFECDARQDERLASAPVLNRALLSRTFSPPSLATPPSYSRFSCLFNPQWDWSRGVAFALAERNYSRLSDPNAAKIFAQPESIQFLVEPGELLMAAGQAEPFFCSLCLIHANARVKMSETFHFAFDSSSQFEFLKTAVSPDMPGDVLAAKQAIFSVALPSKFVFLVLLVHRVLQGDEEATAEPYFAEKNNPNSEASVGGTLKMPWKNPAKKLEKIRNYSPHLCGKMGGNLQQFAFAAIPVFDSEGRFILTDSNCNLNSLNLWPPGSDVCELIMHGEKKKKIIAVTINLSVRRISAKDSISNRLDTSLCPYVNSEKENKFEKNNFIRDMFDLMPVPKILPNLNYVGTLFFSPLSLNLPFVERKKSIICRVEFRGSDDESVTVPIKNLFSGSGAINRILTDTVKLTAVYNSKSIGEKKKIFALFFFANFFFFSFSLELRRNSNSFAAEIDREESFDDFFLRGECGRSEKK